MAGHADRGGVNGCPETRKKPSHTVSATV